MKHLIRLGLLTLLLAQAALAGPPDSDELPQTRLPWQTKTPALEVSTQAPEKVGDEWLETHVSPAYAPPANDRFPLPGMATEPPLALVWEVELVMPFASYIAPHFSHFALPEGAQLTVRSPDGSRSWTYTGFGKGDRLLEKGFWGIHIPGEVALLEIHSRVPLEEGAVRVDSFAHGHPETGLGWDPQNADKALCGNDNTESARCYQFTEPAAYNEARAVARLLVNGLFRCTGWLIGNEGHLMTNRHCIASASDALNTDYEFMAEGANCATNCAFDGACAGTVEATSATIIASSAALDYALVRLPTNVTGTYGFLQLRDTGAVLGERIYIPQHPQGWGKHIGILSTHPNDPSGFCEVFSLTEPRCFGYSGNDVGYFCDTQRGSSGSPVVGDNDNLVVALHQCADCPNRGVPIQEIITHLGIRLPNFAIPCTVAPGTPTHISGPDLCQGAIETYQTGAVAGATRYRWEVLANPTFSWVTATPQISISGHYFAPGFYTFRVRAENSCGNSGWRSVGLHVRANSHSACGGCSGRFCP